MSLYSSRPESVFSFLLLHYVASHHVGRSCTILLPIVCADTHSQAYTAGGQCPPTLSLLLCCFPHCCFDAVSPLNLAFSSGMGWVAREMLRSCVSLVLEPHLMFSCLEFCFVFLSFVYKYCGTKRGLSRLTYEPFLQPPNRILKCLIWADVLAGLTGWRLLWECEHSAYFRVDGVFSGAVFPAEHQLVLALSTSSLEAETRNASLRCGKWSIQKFHLYFLCYHFGNNLLNTFNVTIKVIASFFHYI